MLERFEDWYRADVATRERALEVLIARIHERDRDIRAWVAVSPQPSTGDGPLSSIPFGVKDVIETANLPTEYGSPVYSGRRGTFDAAIVSHLRARGGVLLGKTHTAAFACRTPPVTRNPRNLAHTPGGSSSGSAAAVAAGMVPFALGTQTHGSVLRPASYCGVTGFKPSFGWFPTDGVLPVAPSLDTLGFFTHTPRDACLLFQAIGHGVPASEPLTVIGVPDPPLAVEPAMAVAVESALATLQRSGFELRRVAIGRLLADLPGENRIVEFYEGARVHESRYREFGDRLLDVADMVREGLGIRRERYEAALAFIASGRAIVNDVLRSTPIIVTPAATGPAPRGLASTGDARINSPWTALGTPAIAIPLPVPPDTLPLGLQLCAAHGHDHALLETAHSVAAVLEAANRPVV
jgi:Asp-tRNA(Asn)/Glu-tRNA(Gln) amidotransferase A subunit family amidase